MKKMMIIVTLAIMAIGASAQEPFKGQITTAQLYADMAQEEFKLSDEKAAKVFEAKKAQFVEMNTTIKPMKDAGKPEEEIKAASKAISKKYNAKMQECIGCEKKELTAFNKEVQTKRKAMK